MEDLTDELLQPYTICTCCEQKKRLMRRGDDPEVIMGCANGDCSASDKRFCYDVNHFEAFGYSDIETLPSAAEIKQWVIDQNATDTLNGLNVNNERRFFEFISNGDEIGFTLNDGGERFTAYALYMPDIRELEWHLKLFGLSLTLSLEV